MTPFRLEVALQFILSLTQSSSLSRRLLILCAVYTAVTAAIFPKNFFVVVGEMQLLHFVVLLGVILMAGLLVVTVIEQPSSPIAFMRGRIMSRGAGAVVIIAALMLSSKAFTTLKYEYTVLVPFFADGVIASIDHAIHFGDPWRWARAILPQALDYPLFLLYSAFWFVDVILAVTTAAFLADRALRERFLASFAIGVILLSTVIRVVANSAGPILYDRVHGGARFAELTASLKASPSGGDTLAISDFLFNSYVNHTEMLGTGISAMPSLHVALAFLNALFFARLGRIARILGWTYFVIVMFGSVYFGWHYALDGYVSIAVMWALWHIFRGEDRGPGPAGSARTPRPAS